MEKVAKIYSDYMQYCQNYKHTLFYWVMYLSVVQVLSIWLSYLSKIAIPRLLKLVYSDSM